jgi:hypothetical protein
MGLVTSPIEPVSSGGWQVFSSYFSYTTLRRQHHFVSVQERTMNQSLVQFFADMALDHSLLASFYADPEGTMSAAGLADEDREAVGSGQPQAVHDRLLIDASDATMAAYGVSAAPILMFSPSVRASDPGPMPARAPLSTRAPMSSRASDPDPMSVRAPLSTRGPLSSRSPDSVRGPLTSRSPDSVRNPMSSRSSDIGPASVRAPISVRSPDSRQFS